MAKESWRPGFRLGDFKLLGNASQIRRPNLKSCHLHSLKLSHIICKMRIMICTSELVMAATHMGANIAIIYFYLS